MVNTPQQAMIYLQIGSYTTLNKFISMGLKVAKIGNVKRFSKKALDDFMNEHSKETQE